MPPPQPWWCDVRNGGAGSAPDLEDGIWKMLGLLWLAPETPVIRPPFGGELTDAAVRGWLGHDADQPAMLALIAQLRERGEHVDIWDNNFDHVLAWTADGSVSVTLRPYEPPLVEVTGRTPREKVRGT